MGSPNGVAASAADAWARPRARMRKQRKKAASRARRPTTPTTIPTMRGVRDVVEEDDASELPVG